MTDQVYAFAVGERIRWEYPLNEFGVVVETLGPPTGIFGNYGVLVKWDGRKDPVWLDDLDIDSAPVVDLLASIHARHRH